MKLSDLSIYGFGKWHQTHLSFRDGIHVIYGPNEAGKSTLHTFIGSMLFGLERGRGRAARTDLYSRYLPWDHDATYGGSLSFEKDEDTYQIQRNFRSDRRSCLLTAPGQAPQNCNDESLISSYFGGLTESLYYNTISIRSLGCAPDASLAQELSRQLTDLQQTGADSLDYAAAMSWLKAQRKHYESLLTPDLERQILQKRQTLAQLTQQLARTTFQEQKAALEQDMGDCLDALEHLPASKKARHTGQGQNDVPEDSHPPRRSSLRPLPMGIALLTFCAAAFLWQRNHTTMACGAGAIGLLFLLLSCLPSPAGRVPHGFPEGSADDPQEDLEEEDQEDPDTDPRAQRIRHRLHLLQKQYESVCRQEWEQDRLLEQAHTMEEELEQLTEQEHQEQEIRLEIQSLTVAMTTLQTLSAQMQDQVSPVLTHSLSRILSSLTHGAYTQVYVDSQLHVQVQAGAHTVPLDHLSRGTIEQIYLAMRLAVIDMLFPQGGMPLLLDDCFLAYDDRRLYDTLLWLAENYSGQVFVFTCQKREASLLSQAQIPFTHISLGATP